MAADETRHLARAGLAVVGKRADEIADHLNAGKDRLALVTTSMMIDQLITLMQPYAEPDPVEEVVHADPEVIFAPPFGMWHEVAPGVEVRVLATDSLGTFRVRRQYAEAMPKTVIIMRNGNSLQIPTTVNSAADIAGLMNAGTPKVYSATDVNDGLVHHVMVAEIQDVYETP